MPSEIAKKRTALFIKKYGIDIAKAIEGTGLFFAAVVGQKCGESAYGTSSLAKTANNFGGIKNYGSLAGAIGRTSSGFAIFRTPYDCFRVYVQQLQSPTKKYARNGVFTAKSPEEQIKIMVRSGYDVTPPDKYLSLCQSAIDSARIIIPIGRVENYLALSSQIQNLEV